MLVTTADLASNLLDPAWVVFDCRHDLADAGKGARLYRAGHVPEAHFADVDADLSGPKSAVSGRHPLPLPEKFAAFLGRHGVTNASRVIAYDDVGGQYAARLWWMLRWIGLPHASLLDGGFPKWVAEGRAVTAEVPLARAAELQLRVDSGMLWTAEDVQRALADEASALVDARAAERFRGEVEPIDRIAGHIPGALNRFYKTNLRSDLTFRPPAELKQEFETLLARRAPEKVGHQCGSGITACANLFAMEYAGLPGSKLYAGSWSEWITNPDRPIAKG